MCKEAYTDQLIGASVDYINQTRIQSMLNEIEKVIKLSEAQLTKINLNYKAAADEISSGKIKINDYIVKNRGGEKGLHGFIAEAAETSISNARRLMEGMKKEILLLDDNGKADLLIKGKPVQVKFYNNIIDGLNTAKNYDDMSMMFPKDTMEVIEKVLAGEKKIVTADGILSNSKIEKIKEIIDEESKRRASPPEKWLMGSTLEYAEVQKGSINKTINNEKEALKKDLKTKKKRVQTEKEKSISAAKVNHKASFREANKAGMAGAAIQGGMTLVYGVYKNSKEGKDLWKYDIEDWKKLGLSTGKSSVKGYVSGSTIYFMSNTLGLSAPLASAATTATFNLVNTVNLYRKKAIDEQGFIDAIMSSSFDISGATLGAILGETLIPIPILGAVIGSTMTSSIMKLGKDILNKKEKEILLKYQNEITQFTQSLNKKYLEKYNLLVGKYDEVLENQDYIFDLNINLDLRFLASVEFAYSVGVNHKEVLKDLDDIDHYFLN